MKLVAIFLVLCFGIITNCYSQWAGASGATDYSSTIYRSGNVGIGTTSSPIGKLQVNGDFILSRNNGAFVFTQPYSGTDHYLAIAPNSGGTYGTSWQWNQVLTFDGLSGELLKSSNSASDIALSVRIGSTRNFKVYGDGRVVIGNVSSPSGYKLYVQDGILAEKVKIALSSGSNWSDFVFDKNYDLNNISTIEQFIKDHKHLPDMPSGEELYSSGGVDVLEMLKLQQQKIEELTLYIIQLNKEITGLKTKD